MTTHRHGPPRAAPRRITACAAAVALLVAGCTSTTADDPTRAIASKSPTAPTPSVLDISPSPDPPLGSNETTASSNESSRSAATQSSLDPAAQEVSDRAAVEAAWAHFWKVTDSLATVPESDRLGAASGVAIDPTLTQVLEQARDLADKGLAVYGSSTFHPYWDQSIDGMSTAVMGDCTDTSQSGSMVLATGERRTVGVPDNNTRVTFVKDADGLWRVKEIFFLVDVKC